jgi:hypothetical protein
VRTTSSGARASAKGGEADDVDEQHCDALRAHLLQWFVVLGQFLHNIGRKVAREIAAFAFHRGMADQEIVAAAHRHGECHRDNHKHNDLRDARAEHDRVGRDQLEQPLIAARRRGDAGGQLWVAIGLPPHPNHADYPKS